MCFRQEAKLLAIDDDDVRDMVRSMLSLDPAARGSATDYVRRTTIADGGWVAFFQGLSLIADGVMASGLHSSKVLR